MNITSRKKVKNNTDMPLNIENGDTHKMKNSLYGDKKNIALLVFLYTLQGIPLGLSSAIPMILQSKASYKQQVRTQFSTKIIKIITSN